MFSIQYGLRSALCRAALAGALLLIPGLSWAQQTQTQLQQHSIHDAFAMYYDALSSRADDLLTASAQHPEGALTSGIGVVPEISHAPGTPVLGRAAGLEQAIKRVQALRPALEPILREEGIPPQMAAVVLVESGGRTTALSAKGARGLWQFMPDTARRYGLVVTATNDERLDLHKSTRAAARYLRDLYAQFGNWPLALAAYNAGEDAVERAIERSLRRDFHSIAHARMLPIETRSYVPAVLNAMNLMRSTDGNAKAGSGQRVFDSIVYARHEAEN